MSLSDGKTSPFERDRTVSPSPARESLKSNLNVTEAAETTALRKKRSWMASLRDVVSKGALQAKAAVDAFRGDQQKAEVKQDLGVLLTSTPTYEASDTLPRGSFESINSSKAHTISSTASLRSHHGRQRSLVSRVTSASMRNHLRNRSKGHSKRASVYSIGTRTSVDGEEDIACPEDFVTPPLNAEDVTPPHKKHNTIAGSIVGSIRGMSRKREACPPLPPPSVDTPITQQAKKTTLPSSPINIPSAISFTAPALALDLGPSGLSMSPTHLAGSPPNQLSQDVMKLMKQAVGAPDSVGSETLYNPYSTCGRAPGSIAFKPVRPRDILRLHSNHSCTSNTSIGPGTPMPMTNLTLDLDGACSEQSEVFERGVTLPNENESKELRTMRSLDAMAEACTVSYRNDEIIETETSRVLDGYATAHCKDSLVDGPKQHQKDPDEFTTKLSTAAILSAPTPRRNFVSAETVHTLPSDMTELTRQNSAHTPLPTGCDVEEDPQKADFDDPFHDSKAFHGGPPSPDRSITLPFRPKATPRDIDAAKERSESCDGEESAPEQSYYPSEPSSPVSASTSLRAQLELQHNFAIAEGLAHAEQFSTHRQKSSEETDPFENPASDDDTQTRAQELLASDIILPNYDSIDVDNINNVLSPRGGLLVRASTDAPRMRCTPDTSPTRTRSCTTYTAGLGDAQYRFSFESWLRDSSAATELPDSTSEPTTPSRRRHENMSLDSLSTTHEERMTPQISPSTGTIPDRTPSMGEGVEFELQRSHRNMRYNALHQETRAPGAFEFEGTPPMRAGLRFIVSGSSEETEQEVVQLADFGRAWNGGPDDGEEKEGEETMQGRLGSEESVIESLRNAARENSQLRDRLDGSEDPFANPAEAASLYMSLPEHLKSPAEQREIVSKCAATASSENRAPAFPVPVFILPPARSSTTVLPSSPGTPSTDTLPAGCTDRVASHDTLDATLALFSSPGSGYRADESSVAGSNTSGSARRGITPKQESLYNRRYNTGPLRGSDG